MSYICEVCGKGRTMGFRVSHAHKRTKRAFYPNLKSVQALLGKTVKRIKVCTRCIRSGWIKKAS